MPTQVQMPPAPDLAVVHSPVDLPAPRAGDPPAAKPNSDHHTVGGQPDPGDTRTPKRQQPVQCRGDAHTVPPLNSSCSRQPAAFTKGRRRVPTLRATTEKNLTRPNARLSRTNQRSPSARAPTQTPEGPQHVAQVPERAHPTAVSRVESLSDAARSRREGPFAYRARLHCRSDTKSRAAGLFGPTHQRCIWRGGSSRTRAPNTQDGRRVS
jgi:hypothetical protein